MCTHAFHRADSKDPNIHVLRVNAGNKNVPSLYHPRKRKVATLIIGSQTVSKTKKKRTSP